MFKILYTYRLVHPSEETNTMAQQTGNRFDQPRIDHPTLSVLQLKRVCTLECVVTLHIMHLDSGQPTE